MRHILTRLIDFVVDYRFKFEYRWENVALRARLERAEGYVQRLARVYPVSSYETGNDCFFCGVDTDFDVARTEDLEDPANHYHDCLWRRAVEYVEDQG